MKTAQEDKANAIANGSIGSVLAAAMQCADVTQGELAERTGVTQSYISQICAGKKIPTIATLERISQCLNLSMPDFFAEADKQADVSPRQLTSDEKLLLQRYRLIGKKQRKLIHNLVVTMIAYPPD